MKETLSVQCDESGVVIEGILLLASRQPHKRPGQALVDQSAVDKLWSGDVVANLLKRCFQGPKTLPETGPNYIVDLRLRSTFSSRCLQYLATRFCRVQMSIEKEKIPTFKPQQE